MSNEIKIDLGGLGKAPDIGESTSPPPSKLIPDNPIAEAAAEPISLNEVFERDPFEYTSSDVDTIITELRRKRVEWELAEQTGAKKPKAEKKAKSKAKKSKSEAKAIDFSQLNITL